MPSTSFDQYVRELEARATDEERAMLDAARERVQAILDQAERQIDRRERIDNYVAKMVEEYGKRPPIGNAHALGSRDIVTLHEWPDDPFNHDGPCVEIVPRKCDRMRFTTLLFKGEIWGEDKQRQAHHPRARAGQGQH